MEDREITRKKLIHTCSAKPEKIAALVLQLMDHIDDLEASHIVLHARAIDLETNSIVLQTRIVDLEANTIVLQTRIVDLEARLHMDSHNSSLSPSSDKFVKRYPKKRAKSNRPSGGQKGHKGSNLKWVEKPGAIVDHPIRECSNCGISIDTSNALEI